MCLLSTYFQIKMPMKRSTTLRIIVLFLAFGFFVSCASQRHRPVHRSAIPAHCTVQSHRELSRVHTRPEPAPSAVTPIRGNFNARR